jgi:hypothetical protein
MQITKTDQRLNHSIRQKQFWIVVILLCICLNSPAHSEPLNIGTFHQDQSTFFNKGDGLLSNDLQSVKLSSLGNVYVQSNEGWNSFNGDEWITASQTDELLKYTQIPSALAHSIDTDIRQTALLPDGRWVAATSHGLMIEKEGRLSPFVVEDGKGRQWAKSDARGVAVDVKGQLWFASLAGVGCLTHDGWQFYEGKDGLPYNDFTCIATGPEGEVWFGTHKGLVRYFIGEWAYRQGMRWLPDDDVRDLKVDPKGNVWVATSNGLSVIRKVPITLSGKADFYEKEIETHIKRTPYGYLSEVSVSTPGQKDQIHYNDSDNDGLWSSMYGAGECFAYSATKNPKAKQRAHNVFKALQFLQTVTQGGDHPAPKGFVARTIRSTNLPNPNDGRLEHDKEIKKNQDRLWKAYEPRWPKSADGKWFWKSDTSSDELDGHYFFYPLYYDLVAETEKEKEEVRQVVRDLTDHLIVHGYNLVDHTGTVTRWGVYNPDAMNHDPNWWVERGLKSLSMLSYLAVAAHVTGESRYLDRQAELIRDHSFDTNALIYKIHRGIGSGNQSDDEMAFMCYYNLLRYTPEGALKEKILLSFYAAWLNEEPELNPFFHFAYAAHGKDLEVNDPWGPHSVSPKEGWLEDSILALKGFPLDRFNWSCQNSHRLDIVRLPHQNSTDLLDKNPRQRGYRINGKVLPVENRHFNHWNTDPWQLDYGGGGNVLASGTVYLLPYYMGLYHGFIAP